MKKKPSDPTFNILKCIKSVLIVKNEYVFVFVILSLLVYILHSCYSRLALPCRREIGLIAGHLMFYYYPPFWLLDITSYCFK